MTLKCFFLGCRWGKGLDYWNSGERLLMQTCQRCGACRTISQ